MNDLKKTSKFKTKLLAFKTKQLSTDYPRWRNITFTIVITTMCLGEAACFWYLYATEERLGCHTGYVYMSVIMLVFEMILITYMYKFNNIPRFARDAMTVMICCANIWFGLFIFSLKSCNV